MESDRAGAAGPVNSSNMRQIRPLLNLVDRISIVSGYALSALIPVLVFVIAYEVVARYFFNAPTIWAHDLSIMIFGYVGLLGGAFVHQRRRHISVDVIYTHLSPRMQAGLDLVTGTLVFFFLVLVFIYGLEEARRSLVIGARFSTEWAPPKGHFMLMIPVGAALLFLQGLANWIRSLHVVITGRSLSP